MSSPQRAVDARNSRRGTATAGRAWGSVLRHDVLAGLINAAVNGKQWTVDSGQCARY